MLSSDSGVTMQTGVVASLLVLASLGAAAGDPRPRPPRAERVVPNDNRAPAGVLRGGVLALRLEARLGDWHPDGDSAPGVSLPAFAEEGRPPRIPGPLVRVPAGTEVAVTVRNSLGDTLTVYGLHDRRRPASPRAGRDSLLLAPGATRTVRFRLDAPGTYYYTGTTMGRRVEWRTHEDAQLSGAIVVDERGAPPPRDRVFVIGMWSDTAGRALVHNRTRILAVVNGRSWPHTERLDYTAGDTVRWRVVNATADAHPMHLHGFYFTVDSRGNAAADSVFASADRLLAVTQVLLPGETTSLTWVPERPGNWLFHCHLPEHFGPRGPLGVLRPAASGGHMAGGHGVNHALREMNGLVMGIHVRPSRLLAVARPTSRGSDVPRRSLRLLVRPSAGGSEASPRYAFALQQGDAAPVPDSGMGVAPPIVLTRGEPVRITVVDALPVPTAVHWHGIELESYYDGVPGFSGDGARLTPIIAPGDSFEVRFTPPRAGTFIYHTHADEERQQLAGLAGPIVVLEPGARFDPATDIPVMISTPRDWSDELKSVLLDGSLSPAPRTLRAGVAHRFRFVNMTMHRPNISVVLMRDASPLPWRPLAKDGADLPPTRRVPRLDRQAISIGETLDLEVTPDTPGEMRIEVRGATGLLLATLPVRVVAR